MFRRKISLLIVLSLLFLPAWCAAASSRPQIPPGEEGKINVRIKTEGYGGRRVQESIRVETNDPARPLIHLSVTGMVEKFAEITPERVRFSGKAGTPMVGEVSIIPRKEYPFTIEKISAKSGEFINTYGDCKGIR